jgi:HEAT repeat protein
VRPRTVLLSAAKNLGIAKGIPLPEILRFAQDDTLNVFKHNPQLPPAGYILPTMKTRLTLIFCALLLFAPRSLAYIDICPTLGRIILESSDIALVQVDKTHRDKRIVIFKKLADLKGQIPDGPIKHQLTDGHPPREPRHILDWAAPGQIAVLFVYRNTALVCTGPYWYEAHRATAPARGIEDDGGEGGLAPWWRMSLDRPELALVYCGSPARLVRHVKDILAGQRIVITTVAHGAQGRGSFSDCVFNDLQAGAFPPLQRLYANLNMPQRVYDIDENSPSFVGLGAIDKADIPVAIKSLESADPGERLDALNDLVTLGPDAAPALPVIRKLVSSPDPTLRLHAAMTLARIDPTEAAPLPILIATLADPSPATRRIATQCLARLGPQAHAALDPLLKLVTAPDPDENVRAAALDAIGRLGPRAASTAVPELTKLLRDHQLRRAAAESLGRIGPAASAALPDLAKAISDADATWQWTAVRAMVLIGGDGARPAVPFLIDRTQKAPRSRELYQLTWLLGLLGPVARDALPALAVARHRDNELASMAMWAIAPEEQFPWQLGYIADRPCDLWLFADYIDRMGDRATPAAAALANRILDGTAGRVPTWGYHLLKARRDTVLPILNKALENPNPVSRRRAQLALREIE